MLNNRLYTITSCTSVTFIAFITIYTNDAFLGVFGSIISISDSLIVPKILISRSHRRNRGNPRGRSSTIGSRNLIMLNNKLYTITSCTSVTFVTLRSSVTISTNNTWISIMSIIISISYSFKVPEIFLIDSDRLYSCGPTRSIFSDISTSIYR